jgi:DNA-binding FrmR family transcriptional regulator
VTTPSGAQAPVQADAQRKVINRLRRAQGQLNAVIAAVEADASCRQVVTQLAAVSSALDRAGFAIIASTLEQCVRQDDPELDKAKLEKLFLSLA